jgi:hypothetical protein
MQLLFDTNIFIYHFNNQFTESGTALLREGMAGKGTYSVITRIEVLGYKQSELDESNAKQLLNKLVELPLTAEVAERTIAIRKDFRIKVPDAIIAATALKYSLQLVSRNEDDFAQIEDLKPINPFKQ